MENEIMTQVLLFATVIAAFVTASMEMIKRAVTIPTKWIPITAFVVGVVIGALAYPFTDMEIVLRMWAGGISGWMASGLYENAKQIKKM